MSDRRPAAPTLQTQYQRYQAAQQQRARTEQQAATAVYAQYVSAFAPSVAPSSAPPPATTTTTFVRGGVLAPSTAPVDAAPGASYVLGRASPKNDDWYDPAGDDDDDDHTSAQAPPPKRCEGATLGAVFALGSESGPTAAATVSTGATAVKEDEAEDPDVDRELHRERERKRVALAQLQAQFAQQERHRRTHGSGSGSLVTGPEARATTNVFVGGLTQRVTEAALFARFRAHGPIGSVKIMKPRTPEELARAHTSGFVAFMRRRDAERAKAALDGAPLDGSPMNLDWGAPVPLPPAPLRLAHDPDTGVAVLRPSTESDAEEEEDIGEGSGNKEEGGDEEGNKALETTEEADLQKMLEGLTMVNASVRNATGWCCDHSACARAVVDVLRRAFAADALWSHSTNNERAPMDAVAALLAKLFLVSDLLYNSSVAHAALTGDSAAGTAVVTTPYRAALQDALPDMFRALAAPRETPINHVALLRLRENVARVLRTWERWAVFPQSFLVALRSAASASATEES